MSERARRRLRQETAAIQLRWPDGAISRATNQHEADEQIAHWIKTGERPAVLHVREESLPEELARVFDRWARVNEYLEPEPSAFVHFVIHWGERFAKKWGRRVGRDFRRAERQWLEHERARKRKPKKS